MTTKAQPSDNDDEMMTAQQCADLLNVKLNTFWAYTAPSRGYVPPPDGREPFSGKPFWRRKTILSAKAARAGQGKRTDLVEKTKTKKATRKAS